MSAVWVLFSNESMKKSQIIKRPALRSTGGEKQKIPL